MQALQLMLLTVACVGIVAATMFFALPRFQSVLSRIVDRYRLRPSALTAFWLVLFPTAQIAIFWLMSLLKPPPPQAPGWLFTTGMCVLLAMIYGMAIELIRKPPAQEFRPSWYQGEGDPTWIRWRRGMKSPMANQVTLSWLLISLTVFCALMGTQSSRLAGMFRDRTLHRRAVERMAELDIKLDGNQLNLLDRKLNLEDLDLILNHRELHGLGLSGKETNDETLRVVGKHRQLSVLSVRDSSITDDGLAHISTLTNLHSLDLWGTQITDAGLDHFQNLLSLENLNLSKTGVTGTGLAAIANKPGVSVQGQHVRDCKLNSLWLYSCELSREGLQQIALLQPRQIILDRTPDAEEIVGKTIPQSAKWSTAQR